MENNKNNQKDSRISVKNLRQNRFKVRVGHYRWAGTLLPILQSEIKQSNSMAKEQVGTKIMKISPKGGKTTIELTKDGIDAKGEAICCLEDNYNRKLGVKIALGRALAAWQAKKSWPFMPDKY